MVTKTNTPAATDEPGDHELVPSLPPTTEQSGTVDTVVLRYLDGRERRLPPSTAGLVTGTGEPLPAPEQSALVDAQLSALGQYLDATTSDDAYAVVVDQRDLWDALRATHRVGQSCGRLIGTESWHKAGDYATSMVQEWGFRRPLSKSTEPLLFSAIAELLDALPKKRDWLNPHVERVLRDALGQVDERD